MELFTRATISSTTVSPNSTTGKSTRAAVAQQMRRLYIRTLESLVSVLDQGGRRAHVPGFQLTGLDALNCKWWERGPPARSVCACQRHGGHVVVGGGSAHKLLYAREKPDACFVGAGEAEFP